MNFEREITEDIIIENVNLTRATYKEAEEFRKFIQNDIEAGSHKIIIDMKNCEFMDSSFLGVLVITLKKLDKLKGALKLASIHGDVQIILDLTRVSELFNIYKDKEEAVKSFRFN